MPTFFTAANKQNQDLNLGSQAPEPQIEICMRSQSLFEIFDLIFFYRHTNDIITSVIIEPSFTLFESLKLDKDLHDL